MARLTNRQMDVLAERVTDLLEEANREANKSIIVSPEYVNFETEYSKDPMAKDADGLVLSLRQDAAAIAAIKKDIAELESKSMSIKQAAAAKGKELGYYSTWTSYADPEEVLKKYLKAKKEEKFPNVAFDREKTLRRVQADILLSDVDNPEALVKSLVEKLK